MKKRILFSKLAHFIIINFIFLNAISAESGITEKYPIKYKADQSKVFKLFINGEEIFVEDYKDIHYARFAFDGSVEAKIIVGEEITKSEISPRRSGIVSKINGSELTFVLKDPRKLVIYINKLERLFIFADSIVYDRLKEEDKSILNIIKYKVDITGKRLETKLIQKAIDDAAKQKKTLFFPAGVYLTGTLQLKSNSDLYLDSGAMILGSSSRIDYPMDEGFTEADQVNDPENYSNKGWKMTYSRLILIDDANNVKIRGRGIIDGQGSKVRPQGKPANLIRIRNSENVIVEGVLLRDPAAWNTHILASNKVTFQNVKMINDRETLNTDGIDPDGARNVIIDNCFMYCSDDNIAIKTSGNSNLLQTAENIVVKNCVFLTKKSAMKLGTETRADIRNIKFDNNDVIESDRGMSLYSRDGSLFENISFTNNYFERMFEDNQQRILQFELGDRAVDDAPGYIRRAGQIKNIIIENCTFDYKGNKESNIDGFNENHKISGVHFKNLTIQGRLCRNLNDAWIKLNKFTQDVTFEVSEQKNN